MYIQRNVCLNGLSAPFLYAQRTRSRGRILVSFLLCAVSLYPGNEALETRTGRREENNEERSQGPVGLGQVRSREAEPETLKKAESWSPRGATQDQSLFPPWRTLAEHKH